MEKTANQNVEKPPSYIECLINSPMRPPIYEAKDEVTIVDEEKKNMEENGQDNVTKS